MGSLSCSSIKNRVRNTPQVSGVRQHWEGVNEPPRLYVCSPTYGWCFMISYFRSHALQEAAILFFWCKTGCAK